MKILFTVTVEKADHAWVSKSVLGSGETPTDCRNNAISKAEAAAGEGAITRNFMTLGLIDIE